MIYYIQEIGNPLAPIKIGYTGKDPQQRLCELQTGYPGKLCVLHSKEGDPEDERAEHGKWDHLHIFGEWFRPGPDLVEYITLATHAASIRTESEAKKIAEKYWQHDGPLVSTGLLKKCPRCDRFGWVFLCQNLAGPEHEADAIVVWDGKPRWFPNGPADIDCYEPKRLFRPRTGCGLDEGKPRRPEPPKPPAPAPPPLKVVPP